MNEVDISHLPEVFDASFDESVRAIKIELFSGVIRDTRVDTGRLRGNWQTTADAPAQSEIERLDPTGEKAIDEVKNKVTSEKVDFLTNNLPYAATMEEKDGMIDKNVARLGRIIKDLK